MQAPSDDDAGSASATTSRSQRPDVLRSEQVNFIHRIGEVVDARGCTIQGPTGYLYLDACVDYTRGLFGYELPTGEAVSELDLRAELSSLHPEFECIAITHNSNEALKLAGMLAGELDGPKQAELASSRNPGLNIDDIFRLDNCDLTETPKPNFISTGVSAEIESFARTGSWFASANCRPCPRLIVLGESLSYGVPFGAVLSRYRLPLHGVVEHLIGGRASDESIAYAFTAIQKIRTESLLLNSQVLIEYLAKKLRSLESTCAQPMDINSSGLDATICFKDPTSAEDTASELRERGILVRTGAGNAIRISLPLIIRPAEIDAIVGSLRAILMGIPPLLPGPCCNQHHTTDRA